MEIEKVDNQLYKITKDIYNLGYINPINQKEEKEKFFSSNSYNPQFKNDPLHKNTKKHKKYLEDIKLKNSNIEILLKNKAKELITWINLIENTGKKDFTKYSLKLYGKPSKSLTDKANQLIKLKTETEEKTISSKELSKIMDKKLKEKYPGWKSEEKANLGSRIDASTLEKTLYVKKGEKFSKDDIKRLIVHEIGVHTQRFFNGEKQKYKIFLYGTSNYTETEEGLAFYMEEKYNLVKNINLKNYAGRVLAIDKALKSSFRETFNYLNKFFPKEDSYHLTLRAKRGLSDTSQPGAFTKDLVYLKGHEKVKKYLQKHPNHLNKLLKGHISIKSLDYLK
tara:strand:+ start:79 stop:1089 length:1011 start_codon:yes stop_codon:yes gene_type:complete